MPKATPDRPVPHGTANGYMNYKCRCDPCKAAKAAKEKAYREANAEAIAARKAAYYQANRERLDEANREWIAANPDRNRTVRAARRNTDQHRRRQSEFGKAWYRANREHVLTRTAAWQRANPEAVRASAKRWREANSERVTAIARLWAARNPEAVVACSAKRRARKRAGDVRVVTKRDWRRLCARYDNCCAYCRRQAFLTQDHIIPIARGGRHAIGNLLPACRSCNSRKRINLLIEWRVRLSAAA